MIKPYCARNNDDRSGVPNRAVVSAAAGARLIDLKQNAVRLLRSMTLLGMPQGDLCNPAEFHVRMR